MQRTSYVNITQKLKLTNRRPVEERVLITDRNHRSYIMPDMSSHIGSKIFMGRAAKYYIDVSIQERNFCENDEKPMTGENFKKCVDDKIQEDFR